MLCLFVVVVVFISKEKKAKDGVTKYKDISRERHKQRKVRKKKRHIFFLYIMFHLYTTCLNL